MKAYLEITTNTNRYLAFYAELKSKLEKYLEDHAKCSQDDFGYYDCGECSFAPTVIVGNDRLEYMSHSKKGHFVFTGTSVCFSGFRSSFPATGSDFFNVEALEKLSSEGWVVAESTELNRDVWTDSEGNTPLHRIYFMRFLSEFETKLQDIKLHPFFSRWELLKNKDGKLPHEMVFTNEEEATCHL